MRCEVEKGREFSEFVSLSKQVKSLLGKIVLLWILVYQNFSHRRLASHTPVWVLKITYTLVYGERNCSDSTLSIQARLYEANLAVANIALQKNQLNTQFSNNGSIGTGELEIPRVKYTVFLIVLEVSHFLPTAKPLKTITV